VSVEDQHSPKDFNSLLLQSTTVSQPMTVGYVLWLILYFFFIFPFHAMTTCITWFFVLPVPISKVCYNKVNIIVCYNKDNIIECDNKDNTL
jgi:hypothetical protein